MKFARILRTLLALALVAGLLAAVGCDGSTGTSSEGASSTAEASSGIALPSGDVSFDDPEVLPETDDRGWILVANYRRNRDLSLTEDVSVCFPESAPGYVIEGGPYLVDEATFRRLVYSTNVEGTGSIKWKDYKKLNTVPQQKDVFTGEVPVSKLSDPIWLATALPSEVSTCMTFRTNAENMYASDAKYGHLMTIGAVYPCSDNPPADDDTVTICIKDIKLILHTQEKGWFVANSVGVPTIDTMRNFYYMPWGNGTYKLPYSSLQKTEDHIEITVSGKDFNGNGGTKGKSVNPKVIGGLLHFWGGAVTPATTGFSFDRIDGVVASYTVWIQEASMVGHFAATIGADWRIEAGGATDQAFSGYNYLITTQPTTVFGHNVGPAVYDQIMDSAAVQKLLGL